MGNSNSRNMKMKYQIQDIQPPLHSIKQIDIHKSTPIVTNQDSLMLPGDSSINLQNNLKCEEIDQTSEQFALGPIEKTELKCVLKIYGYCCLRDFYLYIQQSDKLIMVAKRQPGLYTSYKIYSEDRSYLGYYQKGLNNVFILFNKQADVILKVKYQPQKFRTPYKIGCYVPYTKLSRQEVHLTSIAPEWSSAKNSYVLPFQGRAKVGSVKNCILQSSKNERMLLFGKITDCEFNLDFKKPLSPIQAMAIALTTFDYSN